MKKYNNHCTIVIIFDNNYNNNNDYDNDYYDSITNGCYLKSEKSVPSNASNAFLIQLKANLQ